MFSIFCLKLLSYNKNKINSTQSKIYLQTKWNQFGINAGSCKIKIQKSFDRYNSYNFFVNEKTMCIITIIIIKKHV